MRGRFKNGRYQQGIGTPETLGVQPTTWKEPETPTLFRTTFTSPNAGISRNYGTTPDYVDTWKSRWEVPKNSGQLIKGATSFAKYQKSKGAGSAPTPPTP